MIRIDWTQRRIDSKLIHWLNALQDEICFPIECKEPLSPNLQLSSAIESHLQGKIIKLDLDQSGKPVPIPGLQVKSGEVLSFLLHLEVTPLASKVTEELKAILEKFPIVEQYAFSEASQGFKNFPALFQFVDFGKLYELYAKQVENLPKDAPIEEKAYQAKILFHNLNVSLSSIPPVISISSDESGNIHSRFNPDLKDQLQVSGFISQIERQTLKLKEN